MHELVGCTSAMYMYMNAYCSFLYCHQVNVCLNEGVQLKSSCARVCVALAECHKRPAE